MSEQFQHILQNTLALSVKEQLTLISILTDRLSKQDELEDLDAMPIFLNREEETILRSRMKEVEEGSIQTIPWRSAIDELKKKHST
ncbi:MAG: hypothetical protein AAFQ92_17885 [Bacteroidota bacterium]